MMTTSWSKRASSVICLIYFILNGSSIFNDFMKAFEKKEELKV